MKKEHIVPLTSIRGLAAVTVAFGHCGFEYFWDWAGVVHPFCWSAQAVDLFFILSAFVLLHNYAATGSTPLRMRDYIAARIARIYPLHVATMIVIGALALLALRQGRITGDYRPINVVQQLLMVNAWPIVGMERTWNYPAWSISIEWFLYLFVLPLLVRRGALKTRAGAIATMLSAMIVAALITANCEDEPSKTTGWIALQRGTLGFMAGWAAWSLFSQHRDCCERLARSCDGVMLAGIAIVIAGGLGWISLWCLLPLGPLLIAALSVKGRSLTCRIMHSAIMVFLGEISYALYMTHAVVAKALNATLFRGPRIADPMLRGLGGAAYLSALLFVAWLVYRFFEVPARGMIRKGLAAVHSEHSAKADAAGTV